MLDSPGPEHTAVRKAVALTRERLADRVSRAVHAGTLSPYGPWLGWRPLRLLAGVSLGAACATKWSGLYVQAELGLRRDVDGTLGEQHVRPEVSVGPLPPARPGEVEHLLLAVDGVPRRPARARHGRVLDA